MVRMKTRGKSSRHATVTWGGCKPYPKQHRIRDFICPIRLRRLVGGTHYCGAFWRQDAKIDDRLLQNTAYRFSSHLKTKTDTSLCILRGETGGTKTSAENLFSLPICVIMELTKSLLPRGRGTALAVEGACVTLSLD